MPPTRPIDELNAETPLEDLGLDLVPVESFYVRSNFEVPAVDSAGWSLTVDGNLRFPAVLGLEDLMRRASMTKTVLLECAGNFRLLMNPVPPGAAWGIGAVGVAEFTGTPLLPLLEEAESLPGTVEWVFTGADRGDIGGGRVASFAFGLEPHLAMTDGPMLAWEMNGSPLTPEHGFPLRLVVPGHYGMRSVKWLTSIMAVDRPFTGHFRQKYRYFGDAAAGEGDPVAEMRVRSLILGPTSSGADTGPVLIHGIAWSGLGAIRRVEVQVDDGRWVEAEIRTAAEVHAPARWSMETHLAAGRHVVRARASDSAGNTQPLDPRWNRNGYGNNVVHEVEFTAE